MAARPWYSCGSGGMRIQASSVSSATTASTSPRSKASAKRVSTSRSAREPGNVPPTDRSGAASSAARARCSALVTAASPVPSISATSAAR